VLVTAAQKDDVSFLQEAVGLGHWHPMSAEGAESAAKHGAMLALEWLLAARCERRPELYWRIGQGSGCGRAD
jgi:hypothetical protein